jgi:hypothetical protein
MTQTNASYSGLTIIIPTRNRSDLAIRALRSVLEQKMSGVKVLVSDNSTEDQERSQLRAFCDRAGSDTVRYFQPAKPLPMAEHWDWILAQALEKTDSDHFTILTDRFLFRPDCLRELCDVASKHPDRLVVFRHDTVADHIKPPKLLRNAWSGQLMRISTDHILKAISQMAEGFGFVPVLLNCVAPRRVLEFVRERFGNYCLSIAPDFCFGFRAVILEEELMFYDKPVTVAWATSRSNGASFDRGVITKASGDFLANLSSHVTAPASPIPQINTSGNTIIHEYVVARSQAQSARCPEVAFPEYGNFLLAQVRAMDEGELKERYLTILGSYGFLPETETEAASPSPRPWQRPRPGIIQRIKAILLSTPTKPFWWFLFRRIGIGPPRWMDFDFRTPEEALEFALRYPFPPITGTWHLHGLVKPEWLNRCGGNNRQVARDEARSMIKHRRVTEAKIQNRSPSPATDSSAGNPPLAAS